MGTSPELVLYGHIEGFGNTDVPWNSRENHCELHWGLQGGFRKDRKNYPWSPSEMGRSCVDLFHLKGQLGGAHSLTRTWLCSASCVTLEFPVPCE